MKKSKKKMGKIALQEIKAEHQQKGFLTGREQGWREAEEHYKVKSPVALVPSLTSEEQARAKINDTP